jgi:hypothetical protein
VVLGPGVSQAEGWLWQTEPDGSVAVAATRLPPGARKPAAGGASVGELAHDPDRAAQLQRRDELQRETELS